MSTGTTEITPAQVKFLSQTLDEVDLSVRASNCLKNIDVKYLGELVQYSVADLMRVHNFGRKTLDEIITLFAKQQLSLGLSIPEWIPGVADKAVTAIVSAQASTNLSPSQCAFLAKRLDEVDLSVRTSNCLNTLNIKYFGELVQYDPAELMRIYAFGKKSLDGLTALLAQANLSLDLHIPDWTPDFVSPLAVERTRDTTVEKAAEDWLTPT